MTSRYKYKVLIVIPANRKDDANALAKEKLDRGGGENTFTVGYSTTGKLPITHYIACTYMTKDGIKVLAESRPYFVPGAKVFIEGVSNLKKIEEIELQPIQGKQDVTIEKFNHHSRLASLNLRLVNV